MPIELFKYCLLIFIFSIQFTFAQSPNSEAFAHTFSIVAKDENTGEMAVGVQSHWFSVGTIVAWGKSGVGVVATQSFVNPAFGPDGLQLMENGMGASQALKELVEKDDGRDFRQVAFLDVKGNVDAYTGAKCIESAGHYVGNNFSVQANMMLNEKIVPAMKKAFMENHHLPLAERLLVTMMAAQEAGGDIRGMQSAALIVVGREKTNKEWLDKKVDLRVDDHENPLKELERLLKTHRAYDHMNRGDLAVEHNDMKLAMQEYEEALKLQPDNIEMKYWKAVTMVNNDQLMEALSIFKEVFQEDENWIELTKRIAKPQILQVTNDELNTILNVK